MSAEVSDKSHTTPSSDRTSITSTVREQMMTKLLQRQTERRGRRDQTHSTRFDEPIPTTSSSHPPNSHSSQEGRGTSLKWQLLSERLPEAIEKTAEEQSFLFFTATADDLELPARQGVTGLRGERKEGNVAMLEGGGEEEGEGVAKSEGGGEEERGSEGEGEGGRGSDGVDSNSNPEQLDGQDSVDERVSRSHDGSYDDDNLAEPISFRGQSSHQLLRPPTTVYIPQRVRLELEEKTCFSPSSQSMAAEIKTPLGLLPHYRDDEGLYVGRRPRVKWTNHVTVENRLLHREDKGQGWFDEDGLLLTLPDPLQHTLIRPTLLAHDSTRNVLLVTARKEIINRKLIPTGSSGYRLDLTLSTLHFTHHPLFSVEHVMSCHLRRLCQQYIHLQDNRHSQHLLQKLYAMKAASVDLKQALQYMEGDDGSSEAVEMRSTLQHYIHDIMTLRRERREREADKYRLLQAILRLWTSLKSVRESQGHSNTSLWINFRRQAVDAGEEQCLRQREISEEVEETEEWYMTELTEREATYQTQLAQWRASRKMRKKAMRRHQRLLRQRLTAPVRDGEGVDDVPVEGVGEGGDDGERGGEGVIMREGEERGEEREDGRDDSDSEESVMEDTSGASLRPETESLGTIPEECLEPIPPAAFNPDQCHQELVEYYHCHMRPSGEPILIPVVQNTNTVSQQQHCSRSEQLRRLEVSRSRLKIRVFYNDSEVCTTKEYSLTPEFSVHFNDTFNIEIVQWPKTIKLQVLECFLFSTAVLAEIFVPIPDSKQSCRCSVPQSYHFNNDRVIPPHHTAVGSGESIASLPESGILVTGGEVMVRVCWGEDEEGRVMCPPPQRPDSVDERTPNTTNLMALKKWAEEARLDPNDPRNAKFLNLLQSVPTTTSSEPAADVFRLYQLHERERFVSDAEFISERRFALLEHRHRGHPELKDKSIPLSKEHITASQWKAVKEYQPYKDYELPPTYQGDFHGNRREERNRFLLEVRERVLSRVRSGRAKLKIDDVIHYDIIPNISGLKATLLEFLSPRRPLKPRRIPTRKTKTLNQQVTEAKIVIRIVRAFGVPFRNQHNTSEHSRRRDRSVSVISPRSFTPHHPHFTSSHHHPSQDDDIMGTSPVDEGLYMVVSPYIEVSMNGASRRTTTTSGHNPYWNEELTLPFHPPYNDFSPDNLAKVTDSIQFNLFDEITVDLLQDDRERDTNVHERREKKWLGAFTLPFSTLHARTRIEGTFALEVPRLLLGYNSSAPSLESVGSSSHTHLQMFVSLEPPLSALPPIRDLFSSVEDPHLLRRARQWLQNLHNDHPDRQYLATALDSSGHHVCVCRYVHPQSPPVELCPTTDSNQRQAMELLAHYVSLIPFLPDAITFSGECDIWTTSDQFLHMMAGDEEEHAVLLTNYFLHCGWQTWLVLGHGVPEGPTAYVLTHTPEGGGGGGGGGGGRGGGYWLWNASTGRHSTQYDPHCPLTSVGCIINKQNVWGNVQQYSSPGRITFDMTNSKHWTPLFTSTMEPLDTIQRELVYDETDEVRVRDLQDSIEREIRDHVMSLRVRFITRWNNSCGRILQKMLIRYEENLTDPQTFRDTSELDEIMTSYTLTGSPLHFPYVNILHIVTAIERTGLHLTENRRAEFGLAVYVHPYPNDVVSVRVFLVTMIPK